MMRSNLALLSTLLTILALLLWLTLHCTPLSYVLLFLAAICALFGLLPVHDDRAGGDVEQCILNSTSPACTSSSSGRIPCYSTSILPTIHADVVYYDVESSGRPRPSYKPGSAAYLCGTSGLLYSEHEKMLMDTIKRHLTQLEKRAAKRVIGALNRLNMGLLLLHLMKYLYGNADGAVYDPLVLLRKKPHVDVLISLLHTYTSEASRKRVDALQVIRRAIRKSTGRDVACLTTDVNELLSMIMAALDNVVKHITWNELPKLTNALLKLLPSFWTAYCTDTNMARYRLVSRLLWKPRSFIDSTVIDEHASLNYIYNRTHLGTYKIEDRRTTFDHKTKMCMYAARIAYLPQTRRPFLFEIESDEGHHRFMLNTKFSDDDVAVYLQISSSQKKDELPYALLALRGTAFYASTAYRDMYDDLLIALGRMYANLSPQLRRLQSQLQHVIKTILMPYKYRLLLTGHSKGGIESIVLGHHLRSEFERMEIICFNPGFSVFTPAKYINEPYLTVVVNENDIIANSLLRVISTVEERKSNIIVIDTNHGSMLANHTINNILMDQNEDVLDTVYNKDFTRHLRTIFIRRSVHLRELGEPYLQGYSRTSRRYVEPAPGERRFPDEKQQQYRHFFNSTIIRKLQQIAEEKELWLMDLTRFIDKLPGDVSSAPFDSILSDYMTIVNNTYDAELLQQELDQSIPSQVSHIIPGLDLLTLLNTASMRIYSFIQKVMMAQLMCWYIARYIITKTNAGIVPNYEAFLTDENNYSIAMPSEFHVPLQKKVLQSSVELRSLWLYMHITLFHLDSRRHQEHMTPDEEKFAKTLRRVGWNLHKRLLETARQK